MLVYPNGSKLLFHITYNKYIGIRGQGRIWHNTRLKYLNDGYGIRMTEQYCDAVDYYLNIVNAEDNTLHYTNSNGRNICIRCRNVFEINNDRIYLHGYGINEQRFSTYQPIDNNTLRDMLDFFYGFGAIIDNNNNINKYNNIVRQGVDEGCRFAGHYEDSDLLFYHDQVVFVNGTIAERR